MINGRWSSTPTGVCFLRLSRRWAGRGHPADFPHGVSWICTEDAVSAEAWKHRSVQLTIGRDCFLGHVDRGVSWGLYASLQVRRGACFLSEVSARTRILIILTGVFHGISFFFDYARLCPVSQTKVTVPTSEEIICRNACGSQLDENSKAQCRSRRNLFAFTSQPLD